MVTAVSKHTVDLDELFKDCGIQNCGPTREYCQKVIQDSDGDLDKYDIRLIAYNFDRGYSTGSEVR